MVVWENLGIKPSANQFAELGNVPLSRLYTFLKPENIKYSLP